MLVRTTKRIAGFPPPGKVGEVDDDKGREAVERGDAEDMSSLATRLRRPKPSRPNHPPEVERDLFAKAEDALSEETQDVSDLLDGDAPEIVHLPPEVTDSIRHVKLPPDPA